MCAVPTRSVQPRYQRGVSASTTPSFHERVQNSEKKNSHKKILDWLEIEKKNCHFSQPSGIRKKIKIIHNGKSANDKFSTDKKNMKTILYQNAKAAAGVAKVTGEYGTDGVLDEE